MAEAVSLENSRVLSCKHCGQDVPMSFAGSAFCCRGCEAVYTFIREASLDRFYQLKPSKLLPLTHYFQRQRNLDWVLQLPSFSEGRLILGIEGIQCAACVWVLTELARRQGPARVEVDPALGKLALEFIPEQFDAIAFLKKIQKLGYRVGEYQSQSLTKPSSMLWRLGICWALALNNMSISVSIYLGLNQNLPTLFRFFGTLNFIFAFLSVLVGGSYFFGRSLTAIRSKVLHFDLPIAIGIAAAFLGSSYFYFQGRYNEVYFDTVTLFTALMLTGRYLQERLIQKNRNQILSEKELQQLTVTRIETPLKEVCVSEVRAKDSLLIQPGGLIPTDSKLSSVKPVECSLSWISGESAPVLYQPGHVIPAGAQLISLEAATVEAEKNYDATFLSQVSVKAREHETLPVIWQWVTRWYVGLVLFFAFLGLILWSFLDPSKALFVFVSILVVTCPCSLGVGIPIARALANKALLVRGVIARDAGLLDRWLQIKKVFFDKTGTLTLASLKLLNPTVLDKLSPFELQILFNAALRSRHPASQAIYQALASKNLAYRELEVREIPGRGLEIETEQDKYFLGRKNWMSTDADLYSVGFYRQDVLLATIELEEELLDQTPQVINHLNESGVRVYLLSGDRKDRVQAMANFLGIPASQAYGGLDPQAKAKTISELGYHDALMLGDGINDTLAFEKAHLCGAALAERAHLANRSDFFFVTGSLGWLTDIFGIARTLDQTLKVNLWFAAGYNSLVLLLSFLGVIRPLFCSVLMPASSIIILGYTMVRMRRWLV